MVHKIIDYPGCLSITRSGGNIGILKRVRIPLRPHFGVMAVAPKEAEIVDSIPPGYFGGNMDNWRVGKGAVMYYPVAVPGRCSRRAIRTPPRATPSCAAPPSNARSPEPSNWWCTSKENLGWHSLEGLNYPLLETQDEWCVHGFSYANYLAELGKDAQSEIYKKSSIDLALRDAFRKMRHFLMTTLGLTEDEAISLMSVATDFGVTQVVDGNWGIHAIIKKSLFAGDGLS